MVSSKSSTKGPGRTKGQSVENSSSKRKLEQETEEGGHDNGVEEVDVYMRMEKAADQLMEKLRNAGMEIDDDVARIINDEIATIKAEAARLPVNSPLKPGMDSQRAHSDNADDFQGYFYESYLSQYPSQAWSQEATPPDSFQVQGGQYGAELNAGHADGQSSQPVDHTPVQGEATGSRRVARRKENYSKQEDLALCSAYLNVSRDPIVGTNQSSDSYWSRIQSYFHLHQTGPSRSKESLQHRWHTIQKETSMFCGFKAEQDRLNRSGKTEQDRIDDALKAFQAAAKHDFQFMHCWEVLRNTNKWHNWMQGTVQSSRRVRMAAGPVDDDAANGEPPARPIGRDSAKKRRSEASSSSANNSACLEVLQRLTMSKERELDAWRREATAAADHTVVEQEKVALKKEQIQIQQRQLEMEQRLREEELRERAEDRRLREEERRLREEELREARRLREELREARRLREEAEQKIMMMDLSQLDPLRRAYWELKQQEILNKQLQRGFHPGGSSGHQ